MHSSLTHPKCIPLASPLITRNNHNNKNNHLSIAKSLLLSVELPDPGNLLCTVSSTQHRLFLSKAPFW